MDIFPETGNKVNDSCDSYLLYATYYTYPESLKHWDLGIQDPEEGTRLQYFQLNFTLFLGFFPNFKIVNSILIKFFTIWNC